MLTLNEDTLEIEEDVIKIPSACACFYRYDLNIFYQSISLKIYLSIEDTY